MYSNELFVLRYTPPL